jgi:hypothetical protein
MNLDYLSHALHVTRPLSHVQFPHLAATASPPVKGHLKVLKFDFQVFFYLNFLNCVKIGFDQVYNGVFFLIKC